MAVKMLMVVFWIVMPCGLVGGYQRSGGTYHLQLHSEDHTVSQPR
jgi:hypothetical protein